MTKAKNIIKLLEVKWIQVGAKNILQYPSYWYEVSKDRSNHWAHKHPYTIFTGDGRWSSGASGEQVNDVKYKTAKDAMNNVEIIHKRVA